MMTIAVQVQPDLDVDKVTLTMTDVDARALARALSVAQGYYEQVAVYLREHPGRTYEHIAVRYDEEAAQAGALQAVLVGRGFD